MSVWIYSPQLIFKLLPNEWLARYFHDQELFIDLDIAAMKETVPAELIAAWDKLDDRARTPHNAVFFEIFRMSSIEGFNAITEAAMWQLGETPKKFSILYYTLSQLSYPLRMLITLLDYPDIWKLAIHIYYTGRLPNQPLGREPAALNNLDFTGSPMATKPTVANRKHTPSTTRREASKLDTQDRNKELRKEYQRLKEKDPEKPEKPDTWCYSKIAKLDFACTKSGKKLSPDSIRKIIVE